MSINSALLAGTSGLRANASALAAISDNISNVNTVGYKRLRNDFTALLTQQATNTTHASSGVSVRAQALIGEQGALQASSVSTHLSVAGDGFFVTRERAADANVSDPYLYTRAGQFAPDDGGYLRNAAGLYLYGWEVDSTGAVTANPSELTALTPVRVSGIGGAAQATDRVSMSANLEASQPISAAAATYNSTAAGTNMASGTVTPDFQTSVQIFDSLGGLRTLTYSFLKDATDANTWNVEIHVTPETDVLTGAGLVNGQIAVGQVAFDQFGQFDAGSSTLPTTLSIGASPATATTPGAGLATWSNTLGVSSQTVTLDIGGTGVPGGLTQYDSPSALSTSQVNGTAFGSLAAVDVDDQGFVVAQFTNGLSQKIYQVPIATFANEEGLISQEGGAYRSGPSAGALNLKESGIAGAG
ncbi:MAG: flagellar hook-basal body complex protein, partial [Pseudomonadota bacterium]